MAKILLINPPASFQVDLFKGGGRQQPLGLAYLAAALRTRNQTVEIFDADLKGASMSDILKKIKETTAEVIGFTTFTITFPSTVQIAKRLKKWPNPPLLLLGGPHITALPQDILKFPYFDFAVLGEGEETAVELLKEVKNGQNGLEKINGLAFCRQGKLIITPPRPYIRNLDSLPIPARDLLPPLSAYRPSPGMYRQLPMTNIITSRGCPYRCIFCCRAVFGNFYRARSPLKVVEEMEILVKKLEVKEIRIADDMFNLDEERVLKICRLIGKKKLKFTWTCMARANFVTLRMLQALKKAGCWEIAYGIESGKEEILKTINKGLTMEVVRRAVHLTRKVGLEVRGFFMLGLPGDTPDSMQQTIDFAKSLNLDVANFFITTPYPGTELAQNSSRFGRVQNKRLRSFLHSYETRGALPFLPYRLTSDQVRRYFKKAHREFYLRPSYLLMKISKIRSFTQFKNYLKAFWAILGLSLKS